ncbi:unnamed protein product [Cyprideis torosa]|uniref:protein-serine/threonine phosphatase n=1 Tax=Cyprideis torosa TaxID=163714 RepID=A0A7R8W7H1_9CRUS|nr:unnamed protein product [Cyprideis torosa]CAG0883227.1 unnamed protein product [Cyprideis torosa]
MGQTLTEPVTSKETASVEDAKWKVGSSSMQGWRATMEDSHTHILSLPDDPDTVFFAVYDGHGGAEVAQYAGKNFHKFIAANSDFMSGKTVIGLKNAFLEFDRSMLDQNIARGDNTGSTAIVVVVRFGTLYCANIGDSRCVACVNGKVVELSADHKPNLPSERERIMNAGGFVDFNRVNGNLALSRAFGDFAYKKNMERSAEQQMLTAVPDIQELPLSRSLEFLILACDGIWDVISSHDAVNFVRKRIGENQEPEEICEALIDHCLAPECDMGGLGCDNMTVIIAAYLNGESYSSLASRCRQVVMSQQPGPATPQPMPS